MAEIEADVSTDYKLHRALQRRGIAMHLARLLNYDEYDVYIRWLMREYQSDPIPGHSRVTLAQIQQVDKEVFVRMADLTRAGLGLNRDGTYALDHVLSQVIHEPKIASLMNPRPFAVGNSNTCLLYTSPSPRDRQKSRMPSSA